MGNTGPFVSTQWLHRSSSPPLPSPLRPGRSQKNPRDSSDRERRHIISRYKESSADPTIIDYDRESFTSQRPVIPSEPHVSPTRFLPAAQSVEISRNSNGIQSASHLPIQPIRLPVQISHHKNLSSIHTHLHTYTQRYTHICIYFIYIYIGRPRWPIDFHVFLFPLSNKHADAVVGGRKRESNVTVFQF